ncbi:MAG: hypothetical protein P8104_13680, partial [Gammaproteobacteria bacterium]
SSGEERDRYEHFKQICSQYDIPAGMMQLLWRHLENDFTVIDMDTSLSMNTIDEQNPLEQQQNVEIMQFGENAKNTPYSQPRSRMVEAKERLQEILPLLFAANRRGVVHLKTLSDQAGKQLDMRHITYDQAMQLGSAFVNAIRANLSFTPSVNSYLNSCQMACDMRHSGRVQSATIVNFSDGEPNQKTDPRVEQIYTASSGRLSASRWFHRSVCACCEMEYGCQYAGVDATLECLGRAF